MELRACVNCGKEKPPTADFFRLDRDGYMRRKCLICSRIEWGSYYESDGAKGGIAARRRTAEFRERNRVRSAAYRRTASGQAAQASRTSRPRTQIMKRRTALRARLRTVIDPERIAAIVALIEQCKREIERIDFRQNEDFSTGALRRVGRPRKGD